MRTLGISDMVGGYLRHQRAGRDPDDLPVVNDLMALGAGRELPARMHMDCPMCAVGAVFAELSCQLTGLRHRTPLSPQHFHDIEKPQRRGRFGEPFSRRCDVGVGMLRFQSRGDLQQRNGPLGGGGRCQGVTAMGTSGTMSSAQTADGLSSHRFDDAAVSAPQRRPLPFPPSPPMRRGETRPVGLPLARRRTSLGDRSNRAGTGSRMT